MTPIAKLCRRCLRIKPTQQFYAEPGNADGLKHTCQTCAKELERERYWAHNRQRQRKSPQ